MSEESNLLMRQEETTTAKPFIPIEDFAYWLRDLGKCTSYRGSYVSLNRAGADVLAADADKAFQSNVKCQDMAQNRVDQAICEAKQKMETCISTAGNSSFFQEFRQRFDYRLDSLREKLDLLRTPENTAIVDEMADYLMASEIHRKAKAICDDLSERYSLQAASVYYGEISYNAWDPSEFETGIVKLVAKCFTRYGFSCYEAIQAIEKDAQSALDYFQADFNTQMQEEILSCIIEPMQRMISRLRDTKTMRSK